LAAVWVAYLDIFFVVIVLMSAQQTSTSLGSGKYYLRCTVATNEVNCRLVHRWALTNAIFTSWQLQLTNRSHTVRMCSYE
jgi:hypothetical protein